MLTQKTPTTHHLPRFVYHVASNLDVTTRFVYRIALDLDVITRPVLCPSVVGLQEAYQGTPAIAPTLHVVPVPWPKSPVGVAV